MSEEIKREVVFVGQNREFKSIQEVLTFRGSQNIEINIESGIYVEKINLIEAQNIRIIGSDKTIIKNSILIYESKNIFLSNLVLFSDNGENDAVSIKTCAKINISNCIISEFNYGINVIDSNNVEILGNILLKNKIGIDIITSAIKIESNSIILNKYYNIYINRSVVNIITILNSKNTTVNTIELYKNIIALSGVGLFSKEENNLFDIDKLSLKSKENLCFSNGKNIQNFEKAGFITRELKFLNTNKNDFRLEGGVFENIGASYETLLKCASLLNEFGLSKKKENFIPITNLSVFLNLSLKPLCEEYELFLKANLDNKRFKHIDFIKNEDEISKNDILLIVNALDTNEKHNKIFELLEKTKALKKQFYIFLPSENYTVPTNKINLEKMSIILETKNKLINDYGDKVLYYQNLEDLIQIFHEKVTVKASKITITKLKLENISHFENLEIAFEDKNTCFIGLNGTGKTTLLRAVALALIGFKHKGIIEKNIKNLLKIQGLENHLIERKEGKITLNYKIDNISFENIILFQPTSDGDIEITNDKNTSFEALSGDFIKSLAIGFTQNRGVYKDENNLKQRNEVQLPHVTDLIYLINNESDNRLKAFSTWIINLDAKANKHENELLKSGKENNNIKERNIIKKVFEILSEITEEEISFKEVLNNNDVWITTQNNPTGISIELVSLGFQSIIGWIGYFLQRMAESYHESKDFTKETAICFIDELDIYIHPKWQANIFPILEKHFSNTQFIITTHSPLIIGQLKNDKNIIYEIEKNSARRIYSYGKDISNILFEGYGVNKRPKEIANLISKIYLNLEYEKIDDAKQDLEILRSKIHGNDADITEIENTISILEESNVNTI